MSLRPQAEAPDLDSALDNAFQIRCTIQAARAAHAQFELAHEDEHECVDTGVKWGKARAQAQPNKASRGVGKKGGTSKPSVLSRLGPRTPSVKDRLGPRKAQNDYAADPEGPAPASYGAPGSTADQTTTAAPKQAGRVAGYMDALDKILPKMIARTAQELPFVLVDGRNLYSNKGAIVPEPKWGNLIGETKKCLPSSGGQVIVIWTKTAWDYHDCDKSKERRKAYANWLKPLAANGTKVIFLVLEYDKKETDPKYMDKCIGNAPKDESRRNGNPIMDPRTGERRCDVYFYKSENTCVLPGMTEDERSHLACELDDVLLSSLQCRLVAANRVVQVVSLDKSILKNPLDVKALLALLDRDEAKANFEMAVWTYEVELTWP